MLGVASAEGLSLLFAEIPSVEKGRIKIEMVIGETGRSEVPPVSTCWQYPHEGLSTVAGIPTRGVTPLCIATPGNFVRAPGGIQLELWLNRGLQEFYGDKALGS